MNRSRGLPCRQQRRPRLRGPRLRMVAGV